MLVPVRNMTTTHVPKVNLCPPSSTFHIQIQDPVATELFFIHQGIIHLEPTFFLSGFVPNDCKYNSCYLFCPSSSSFFASVCCFDNITIKERENNINKTIMNFSSAWIPVKHIFPWNLSEMRIFDIYSYLNAYFENFNLRPYFHINAHNFVVTF